MIPERNKLLFIELIAMGRTFDEACEEAQISYPSMFRFLRKDPILRKKYDDAIFEAKARTSDRDKRDGMRKLNEMITKRK